MAKKGRPRRAAGTGQVNWDGAHNTYYANLPLGKDPATGRTRYKRRDATVKGHTDAGYRDAEQKLADLIAELAAEADAVEAASNPENYTLWQAVEDWLAWLETTERVGKTTLENKLRVHAVRWIEPRIGDVPLLKADVAVLSDFMEEIAPDLGASSIGTILGIIRRSIDYARRNRLIDHNDADAVVLPKAGHQPRDWDFLNPDQVSHVLETCKASTPMRTLMMTGIQTGMRPLELRSLRWEDIDFNRQVVFVVVYLKTGTSRRGIPVSKALITALKEHQKTCPSKLWVFPHESGDQLTKDGLAWRVGKVFRQAGLPHRDPYIMRHTFASIMDDKGVEHRTIADLMGHKNLVTFQRIYRHRLHPVVNQTAGLMDDIWGTED